MIGVFASALDAANDSDWWRLSLKAGLTYTFQVANGTGGSLLDANVSIRNAAATVITPLVVGGETLSLMAKATGTYYLDVSNGDAGTGWPRAAM
ncbi:hypothetical protein [Paracoccus sp. S1E-3]|uniref:hypothetical protein n=1 Tax=Paracoccus sp. S1E-3 TaxID=2756130 RepID=UPI0015EFC670|nr:hypothetical protein [Paracoccus sp. S1E-3]MBA4489968.1 hypothetical protein [Paracoccus sp. S1E-3]